MYNATSTSLPITRSLAKGNYPRIQSSFTSSNGRKAEKFNNIFETVFNTSFLIQLFVQSNLAQRGSRDVLRDLAHLSLHVMLDSRLETADDADQVVRALNVLVLKMVEKSDHTAMTRYCYY